MRKGILSFIGVIGSLSGLISLILFFASDVVLALASFCVLCVSFMAIAVIVALRISKILSFKNPDGYSRVASFIKYEVYPSKTNGIYETYRTIRCERPIMSEFKYNFQWRGSKHPIIGSDLQIVNIPEFHNDQARFDSVNLTFKRPLCFGDTATVHFKAEFDDLDNSAKPHVDAKVDSPINTIHYRIILSYKPTDFNRSAVLSRKRIDSAVNCDFEMLKSIPYKPESKSYEYHLIEPAVGYYYRIEWEK